MIILDVQEYCHSCPYFEADIVGDRVRALVSDLNTISSLSDTVIQCRHNKLCENIKRYSERKVKNNGQSESQ